MPKKNNNFGGGTFVGSGITSRWTPRGKTTFIGAKNRNEAFDMAVAANMPTFWWNGLEYNTKKELNPVREFNNRWVGAMDRETEPINTNKSYVRKAGPIGGVLSRVPMVVDTYQPEKNGVPTLQLEDTNRKDNIFLPSGNILKDIFFPRYIQRNKPVVRKRSLEKGGK